MRNLFNLIRPKTFKEIIGHPGLVNFLQTVCKTKQVGNSYIFSGKRGSGKTSLARIFSRAINCDHFDGEICEKCKHTTMDVYEFNTCLYRGINLISDVMSNAYSTPKYSRFKVFVFDEAHMFTKDAFNSLLKIVEEPPASLVFVFLTTDISKIPDTIISRSHVLSLNDFSKQTIDQFIDKLFVRVKTFSKSSLCLKNYIRRASNGDFRRIINLTEQMCGGHEISEHDINFENFANFAELYDCLFVDKNLERSFAFLNRISDRGAMLKKFVIGFIEFIESNHSKYLVKTVHSFNQNLFFLSVFSRSFSLEFCKSIISFLKR